MQYPVGDKEPQIVTDPYKARYPKIIPVWKLNISPEAIPIRTKGYTLSFNSSPA